MHATSLQARPSQSYHAFAAAALAGEFQTEGQREGQPGLLGESIFVRAGTPLYHEEDQATYVYRVIEGAVRAFTFTEDGRRQVNGFRFEGDTFGSGQSGCYRSSAEAITDCSLIRYRRRGTEGDPSFDRFMLEVVLAEIRAAEEQILLLGRMSACSKVAAFLLYLAEHLAPDPTVGTVVSIPMTRYDIADFLGLSAESVSRCLTKMKIRGMIEMETPEEIRLIDLDTLADVPRGL